MNVTEGAPSVAGVVLLSARGSVADAWARLEGRVRRESTKAWRRCV
jgi:hypothetical protein